MQQLFAAAQKMQAQLLTAQQELADAQVEGSAGGGLVKAVVSGQGELLDLTIAPEAIDAADPAETAQTIADLVLAAIRDATRGVEDMQQQKMGGVAADFGGGFPGSFPGAGPPGGAALGPTGFPGLPGLPGPGGTGAPEQGGQGQPAGDADSGSTGHGSGSPSGD
jgi:DNA-binding YbaB/EbfC family protein